MPDHNSLDASPSPQLAFEAFKSFVAQFDPIDLLSQLALPFLFTQETAFIGEAAPLRLWARWIEFTAGYLATHPLGAVLHGAFYGSSIESFENLIKQYFNSLPIYLLTDPASLGERPPGDRLVMSPKI